MTKATKAALLSGLVLPGAGHIYLRSYVRGAALLIVTALVLINLLQRAMQQANSIASNLLASGAADLDTIVAQATAATSRIDSTPFDIGTLVLGACWLFAIIDSYRIGKTLDK